MTTHGIGRSCCFWLTATVTIALSGCADAGLVFDFLHQQHHPPPDHGGSPPDAATGGAGHATEDAESPGCPVPSNDGSAGPGDGAVDAPAATYSSCRLVSGPPDTGICVPGALPGWRGGSLLAAPTPDALPDCVFTGDSPTALVLAGPPPSACGACTCGAPEGLACGAASHGANYFDPECLRLCGGCQPCSDTCATTSVSCAFHSALAHFLELVPAALAAGSCQPSMPPAPPPLSLERAVRVCYDSGGFIPDCGPGSACARTHGRVCVFRDGDSTPCPRGPYRERMVFYAQTTDTRACTACSCGGPAGVTCPTRIEAYGPPPGTCTGTLQSTFETDSICLDVTPFGNAGSLRFVAGEPSGAGTCAPGGSTTGTVTQSEPFTACCIPEGFTVQ